MTNKLSPSLFIIALGLFAFKTVSLAHEVNNCGDREDWVAHAWQHFNDKKLSEASSAVDECMSEWIAQARYDQRRLAEGASCPPEGAVPAGQRDPIFANGVLNDVGTAQWIRARSAHLLGNTKRARELYSECAEFQCARTWDPKGWFWAPGTNCQARLEGLK